MVDLHKLANALNSLKGYRAGLTDLCEFLWTETPSGNWTWSGQNENPTLCFAMLDLFERQGYDQITVFRFRGGYRAIIVGPLPPAAGDGATRTAAVAAALIDAHEAGLLVKDEGNVEGGL